MSFAQTEVKIGRAYSQMQFLSACVVATLLAIGGLILGFMPMKTCEQTLDDRRRVTKQCTTRRHPWFLLMVPLAVLLVAGAYWWNKKVQASSGLATISALEGEGDLVDRVIKGM